jgi:hypothetical protein
MVKMVKLLNRFWAVLIGTQKFDVCLKLLESHSDLAFCLKLAITAHDSQNTFYYFIQ